MFGKGANTNSVSDQGNVTLHPSMAGQLLDRSQQERLIRSRDEDALARAVADRNRWFLLSILLACVTLFCANGWRIAEARFANNVQVSYVKLDPSGGYTVDFYDENRPMDFFQSTVDAKLMEWVNRRYSKQKETIKWDYGFAPVFMSRALDAQFRSEFDAVNVSAEHATCPQCDQIEVRTRVVQHIEEVTYRARRSTDPQKLYTSIAYATKNTRNYAGALIKKENVVVNLKWQFRTLEQIQANKKNLVENPVGIEIVRYDLQLDPNTLPKE